MDQVQHPTFQYQMCNTLKMGSRSSLLAITQTNIVKNMLLAKNPDLKIEIITMETIGDKILDVALNKINDKNLFTKELEAALLVKEVDIVVHSLKDLPTTINPEFVIGSIPIRVDPHDAVVFSPQYAGYKMTLKDLEEGSVIGTSSVRRIAQLKRKYPHLVFETIRGNLNTRLLKLFDPIQAQTNGKGDGTIYDAIILAKAGLCRINLEHYIGQVLDDSDYFYAVGQGALAVECRSADIDILSLITEIHDEFTALSCIAERSLMATLNGGCSTPIAVKSTSNGDWSLKLEAGVFSPDGSEFLGSELTTLFPLVVNSKATVKEQIVDHSGSFTGINIFPICQYGRDRIRMAALLGESLAHILLEKGANDILAKIIRPAQH